MAELGFLDQNENRSYPFTVVAEPTDIGVRRTVVDLAVRLGPDYPMLLTDARHTFRLVRVQDDGTTWGFVFSRYRPSNQGDELLVPVPKDAQRFSTHHAMFGNGSYIYLTVGQIKYLPGVTAPDIGMEVELRTVVAASSGLPSSVRVYNAKRRQPYAPYFVSNPNNTPGEDYENAKAAAPAYQDNVVNEDGELVTPSSNGLIGLQAGYNLEITASSTTNVISFRYDLGGGEGPNCEETDPDELDQTKQGALKAINGRKPGSNGNLDLFVGLGFELLLEQDSNKIRLVAKTPETEDDCHVPQTEGTDPDDLPTPPSNC